MGDLVSTSRGDFYVHERGRRDGPPIVFVAGLGDDHASWASVLPSFEGAHRCVTFDNRGIGRSPIPPGPYTIREMADDAHEVVRALGLRGVTAIGSSMGGAICQEWTLAHPEDVSALVLTNTWGERDPYVRFLLSHWISLAEQGLGRELLESLVLFCFSPGYLSEHPDVAPAFVAGPPPDLRGAAAAAAGCREHHALDRVGAIRIPTLVIVGAQDILLRPVLSERLAAAIPNATLRSIDAAHMIFWERPDEFAATVIDFLRSCGGEA